MRAPLSRYGPRNAVALSLFSLFGPGIALEYESFAFPRRVSIASGLGYRASAAGEYSSFTVTPSLELRYWLYGRSLWSNLGDRAMVGPFASLREDVSWTALTDTTRDRLAGTSVEFAETFALGYRFTVGPVAVTQSHGFTVATQLDPRGRLAETTYFAVKLAVTVGVMF